jgi:hypothetical protein
MIVIILFVSTLWIWIQIVFHERLDVNRWVFAGTGVVIATFLIFSLPVVDAQKNLNGDSGISKSRNG